MFLNFPTESLRINRAVLSIFLSFVLLPCWQIPVWRSSAFVMGTAQGRLYQQAVGLRPGTVYFSFVNHIYFLFIVLL